MSWQRLQLRFWNTCNLASGMVRQGSTLKAAASALEPPASLNFALSHREPDLEPGTICSEHRARLAVSITALCCSWQRELLSLRLWLRPVGLENATESPARLAVFISALISGLQRVRWCLWGGSGPPRSIITACSWADKESD